MQRTSSGLGLIKLAMIVGVVGVLAVAYNAVTHNDEGRVAVSAYLEYSPVDRDVVASWKLGFDIHRETIHHSPFGTAGAAHVGDTIFFVGVPVKGVADMTVKLYVRSKVVRTCNRVEVEMSQCTWIVT
jgi:hypothetical protein